MTSKLYPLAIVLFMVCIILCPQSLIGQDDDWDIPDNPEDFEDIDKRSSDSSDDQFDYSSRNNGYFVSTDFKLGTINNDFALFTGGRIGYTFDQKFSLGLAGYALFSDFNTDQFFFGQDFFVTGGYGGVLFEPILAPESPIYLTFPTTLGAGMIIYDEIPDGFTPLGDIDLFLIAEPGVNLEINAVRGIRFGLSASYRFTTEVGIFDQDGTSLNGWAGGIYVKFGRF